MTAVLSWEKRRSRVKGHKKAAFYLPGGPNFRKLRSLLRRKERNEMRVEKFQEQR